MEYITSNKGGRKLAFENNISIKQKVLSNGTVWGDIMGGFCPGGILSGGFVRGDFVLEPANKYLLTYLPSSTANKIRQMFIGAANLISPHETADADKKQNAPISLQI